MYYHSTRSKEKVSGCQAILQGLAEDGGLFVPETFPTINRQSMISKSYLETASIILSAFFPQIENISAVLSAYSKKFKGDIVGLQTFGDKSFLELYHGRTASFKDMALTVLPGLMAESSKQTKSQDDIFILVATSGDTGSAALEGFSEQEGIGISVFYPNAGVSPIQESQMLSAADTNAHVFAIEGNFDDAQRAVKEIFADAEVLALAQKQKVRLGSANSINIGRLVPQIVYYFYAYEQLVQQEIIQDGNLLDISVPTGNFGDILAGIYAKQMGLPIGNCICASNANDVLTDFFTTKIYTTKRDFHKTLSPSMDILISSNLERYLYLLCEDEGTMRTLYAQLKEDGQFIWPYDFPVDLKFASKDDQETKALIKKVWDEHNYLMDPHTAIAFGTSEQAENHCVVVSTASPFKFPDAVLEALGQKSEFAPLETLEQVSGKTASDALHQKASGKDVIAKEEIKEQIIQILTNWRDNDAN